MRVGHRATIIIGEHHHWLIDQVRIEGTLTADIKIIYVYQSKHRLTNKRIAHSNARTAKRVTVPTTTPHTCNSSLPENESVNKRDYRHAVRLHHYKYTVASQCIHC